MLNYLLIGLGAAIGGVLRFWLSNYTYKFLPETFPYGTLFVNVSGSFILGLIIFYFSEKELLSAQLRIFLAIGFCGGFTTFSTFSLETINLLRESQYWFSFLNIMLNIFLCLLGMYLAYLLTKILG
jgi:CrcB protein